MKNHMLVLLGLSTLGLQAGQDPIVPAPGSIFDNALRPISNPTLFDLPLARTQVHAVYMNHQFPGSIDLAGGGSLAVGGEANIFALQLEYAFNDRFSVVATKDGYADINSQTLNGLGLSDGFANLAAGVKWVFHKNEASGYAAAVTGVVELPTGDDEILQGEGDGALNLIFSNVKVAEKYQLASAIGFQIPFDNDTESTMGFISAHAAYHLTDWLVPLVEINWFHTLDEGDGSAYPVSGAVAFEGGDLFNLGAPGASANSDLVTLALGARFPVSDQWTFGAAYEIPLTDDESSLIESRLTIDAVYQF